MSLAALFLAGNFAKADDTQAKNTKSVSDAASKIDLSTPVNSLKFYGSATVGYETTFGKTACSSKNSQGGMFSQIQLGTDIKLADEVTMSLQVTAGRYSSSFGLLR